MARARLPAALALSVAAAVLGGCLFDPPPTYFPPPEDPEVASRCTPVRALLSKNFYKGAQADLGVISAGTATDIRGAILSPDEAARVSKLDFLCRAWVKGAISDVDYGRALLGAVSMSIVETARGRDRDRDALAEAVAGLIDQLRNRGIVPATVTPGDLPAQVKSDSHYSRGELERRFAERIAQTHFDFGKARERDAKFQADVILRLRTLENATASLPPSQPAADATVYFSTGSAELTHDARQRLGARAGDWAKQGIRMRVTGHADPRGSAAFNRALSRRRAEAVAAELARLGVAIGRVEGAGASGVGAPSVYDAYRRVRIEPDSQSRIPLR